MFGEIPFGFAGFGVICDSYSGLDWVYGNLTSV